jgi:hypothetical protein
MCRGDGDGRDGYGFGVENARAEADGSPLMLAEEGDLFGRPAAFGPMAMTWRGFCAEGEAVDDRWKRFASQPSLILKSRI